MLVGSLCSNYVLENNRFLFCFSILAKNEIIITKDDLEWVLNGSKDDWSATLLSPAGRAAAPAQWGCRRSPRGTGWGVAALLAPYWSHWHFEEERYCWSCCWQADALHKQDTQRENITFNTIGSGRTRNRWEIKRCKEMTKSIKIAGRLQVHKAGMQQRLGGLLCFLVFPVIHKSKIRYEICFYFSG